MRERTSTLEPVTASPFLDWIGVVIAIGVAAQWVLVAVNWGSLPAVIPIHFNAAGEADRTGSRWLLLLFPVISTAFLLLLRLIRSRPDLLNIPWRLTPENTARQRGLAQLFAGWVLLLAVALQTYLTWQMIRIAAGELASLPALLVPLTFAVLLGSVAGYLWQARRAR